MSIHIRPTAPLAQRALLPADPGLALALAQALLETPRMFNHQHGLWGYTGRALDGEPLTIQSTGIGGPSAAIVLEELIGIGLTRAVRVGTCVGLGAALELGDLLIADAAVCADGASRALGAGELTWADAGLSAALSAAGPETRRGRVVSTDLFYDPPGEQRPELARDETAQRDLLAVDLEAAALFALGARRAVAIGCVLVVAELRDGSRRERIDDQPLAAACERAGRLGAGGLGAGADPPEAV